MKDDAKEPARETNVAERDVVFPKRIAGGYAIVDLCQAVPVGEEIEKREHDREWLLDAGDAMEWPFSVILNDRIQHGRISGDPLIGDNLLAHVVAIGWTGPEKKAEMER